MTATRNSVGVNVGDPTRPRPGDILDITDNAAWMADALCTQVDPEAFFPEKGGNNGPVKALCNGSSAHPPCPVRTECLVFALDNPEASKFGIWGGTSERERRKLKKRRRAS